jgi:hypothetical protein
MFVILVFEKLMQGDYEFKASSGYLASLRPAWDI